MLFLCCKALSPANVVKIVSMFTSYAAFCLYKGTLKLWAHFRGHHLLRNLDRNRKKGCLFYLLWTTYGIWSKTKSITAETHDLTWKTPPMRRGKTTGTSQQQSHYLKSLGYTPMAAYKRIKSPRNPSKGIYVPYRGGLRPSLRLLRASASLRQKPGLYLAVNLEQLQHYLMLLVFLD
jgi:hypothetical protein